MAIGLDDNLHPENAGPLSVSVEVRGMPRVESVVVGVVDFEDYTAMRDILWAELSLLGIGAVAGLSCWLLLRCRRFAKNKVDERAVFREEHNPNAFH